MLATEWRLVRATLADAPVDAPFAVDTAAVGRLAAAKARVPAAQRQRRAWDAVIAVPEPRVSHAIASRAYHKLREILQTCALPSPRTSLHLGEAPGGFVQALGDELRARGEFEGWSWLATSLAIDGAPVPRDDCLPSGGRFVFHDLLRADDVEALVAAAATPPVDLVTADGAAVMDHDHLEAEHLPLLWAQTRVAARCLRKGGTLVIKFFEGATRDTQLWMAWCAARFRGVALVKPHTSRATNSERYLVARGFEGGDAEAAPLGVAPAWRRETQRVVDAMADAQSDALETALSRVG